MMSLCAQLKNRVRTVFKNQLYFIDILESNMFKQTATDLTTVSPESFEKWLNSFDIVLSDVDGKLLIKIRQNY